MDYSSYEALFDDSRPLNLGAPVSVWPMPDAPAPQPVMPPAAAPAPAGAQSATGAWSDPPASEQERLGAAAQRARSVLQRAGKYKITEPAKPEPQAVLEATPEQIAMLLASLDDNQPDQPAEEAAPPAAEIIVTPPRAPDWTLERLVAQTREPAAPTVTTPSGSLAPAWRQYAPLPSHGKPYTAEDDENLRQQIRDDVHWLWQLGWCIAVDSDVFRNLLTERDEELVEQFAHANYKGDHRARLLKLPLHIELQMRQCCRKHIRERRAEIEHKAREVRADLEHSVTTSEYHDRHIRLVPRWVAVWKSRVLLGTSNKRKIADLCRAMGEPVPEGSVLRILSDTLKGHLGRAK